MRKDGIEVKGHRGKWYVIDEANFVGGPYYLLEHETYGDEAACVIVDSNYNLICEDVWNGFEEEEFLEYLYSLTHLF